MNRFINSVNIFILAFLCLSLGLIYSRFLISMGMIFFLLAALINSNLKKNLLGFINNKYYLSVSLIFFIFFISGIWSDDHAYFLNRMRIKLPFLFLPFAFYSVKGLNSKHIESLMCLFVAIITTSVFWSLAVFLSDFNHYIEIYGKGQILPTPIHHIRYSLLVVSAVLMCIFLFFKSQHFNSRTFKLVSASVAVLLIVYLHFLAVRSGLMCLYVIFVSSLVLLYGEKAYRKWISAGVMVMVISIFLSWHFIPTIKNKIGYMKYSLELFEQKENIRDLSDSRRLGSIYAGLSLMKQHPWFGVGIGDLMDETNSWLEMNYPELTDLELLPHNQYILTGTALGIPAMLFFVILSLMPLFYKRAYRDIFMLGTQLMFIASFMVEHTIESQIGVAAYIFIVLFAMKHIDLKRSAHA